MDIVFTDIETTGLDPQRHTITEIAMIKGDIERCCAIELWPNELAEADSMALSINGHYKLNRYSESKFVPAKDRMSLALEIAVWTDGCILAGNNVKFDQQFLEAWLRNQGQCPSWNYHVLDVPTFAAGVWGLTDVPFTSRKVSELFDVPEPQGAEAHTALADAMWSKRLWEEATKPQQFVEAA